MSKATGLDDYFGLVFRAVKGDECVPRAIAFIKRLLQMSYLNECNFTAASLLVISEILKSRQDIRISLFTFDFGATAVTTAKVDAVASEDDDEERFVDVDKVIKQNKPA
jgi:ribosome biogenesis protein MAK21